MSAPWQFTLLPLCTRCTHRRPAAQCFLLRLLPAAADVISANLGGASSYHRLDFCAVRSSPALEQSIIAVCLYSYWEQSRGWTAVSSSEVTGRLGGYDYKQLAPPAILSSSSAATSKIQIPRWPFDITFNFYLREKWNTFTLSHSSAGRLAFPPD